MANLESMVKSEKNLVFSDLHFPYQDDKAINIMFKYAKEYQPDNIFMNGDIVDFYNLSKFDKDPNRKKTIADEIEMVRKFFDKTRSTFPKSNIYFIHGNHENRLQRYLWENPELAKLSELDITNLFKFSDYNIKEVKVSRDYWSMEGGTIKQGNAIIMHGDSRLNGASTSKYSGYSAKNTMLGGINESIIMGHIHRLAIITHSTPKGVLVGIEGGCLCQVPKIANWERGFVTFETVKNKNYNYRLHLIENDKLIEDGKIYGK